MRLAILSDIHGIPLALDAVLAEESPARPLSAARGHRGGQKLLLDQGLPQRCRLVGLAHELATGSAFDLT